MRSEPTTGAAWIERVAESLRRHPRLGVAASGGVDSLTLAHLAARTIGAGLRVFHAVSPAVAPEATARVRRHARDQGWALELFDAGEFADPRYRTNPVDRCFHCKNNLYGSIAERWDGPIASGTNTDDLGDFRPGLSAAKRHRVIHPFVEAGVDKALVRVIARQLGLADTAELPAQPCLSSRVETGQPIRQSELRLIHRVELELERRLGSGTLRCRRRAGGVVIELDADLRSLLDARERERIGGWVKSLCEPLGLAFQGFEDYRRGSAFLHGADEAARGLPANNRRDSDC